MYCWVSPCSGSPGVRARHKANEQPPRLCWIAAFSELMDALPFDASRIASCDIQLRTSSLSSWRPVSYLCTEIQGEPLPA